MIHSTGLTVPYQTSFSNGVIGSIADVPLEKGGTGGGFGPHELLEAALATCLTMTVRMSAAKHGIPLAGVRCEVRLDRSAPAGATMEYALAFDGPLTDDQAGKLRGAAARSPVGQTLSGAIRIQPAAPETPR